MLVATGHMRTNARPPKRCTGKRWVVTCMSQVHLPRTRCCDDLPPYTAPPCIPTNSGDDCMVITLAGPLLFSAVLGTESSAAREHRWRHIEHLLFECQSIPGLDSSVALALLRDDLVRVCSGSEHAEAVLLAAFPSSRIPVVAATARVVPFLLDPAAALGRMSPWHMKLQCLDLVAAFLLGVSSAVCTRQPPTASLLARFRLHAWPSVRAWLLRLRTRSDFAPERLPAPDAV